MRYQYWLILKDSDNLPFTVSSSNVSKTKLHKVIDFYTKSYTIVQLLVYTCNIQNPRLVGGETDNRKEN